MNSSLLSNQWAAFLKGCFSNSEFDQLLKKVFYKYQNSTVYPPIEQLFSAFDLCLPSRVKVVIVGQDPYHKAGQANGCSFSVPKHIRIPPSLKTIYKELSRDIPHFIPPVHGNLDAWVRQGVLLLNSVLTVEAGKPGSHRNLGWQKWTQSVLHSLHNQSKHLVFMLWGQEAQKQLQWVDSTQHCVLRAAHPSPLARGAFFGCRHFSRCNDYLIQHEKTPVNWNLFD